ncbi:MAG: heme ABC exporter ATP-binding protein CcmA [Chloroflexi bacterium]|nr:heme ABC exporter ATP-binding protein CcmA [Chloroflexota bacterium]
MNSGAEQQIQWEVEVKGLSKYFGPRPALRGINLGIARGEFLALFGPNGAGKTTLIRILATLLPPTAGTAKVAGKDIRREGEGIRGLIGFVSHLPLLYDNLTARENLSFFGRLYSVLDLEARGDELLEEVGLTHRQHDLVRTYSRGMQQRLALARALLHDPAVLLLDEPYSGLDPQAVERLQEVLAGLARRNKTVLLATHNLEEGFEISHRLAILAQGRIVWEGERDALDRQELRALYRQYAGAG